MAVLSLCTGEWVSSESLLVSCPELKHRKPVVWGCSSVEEYIPSLHEVLCSIPWG